MVCHFHSHLFSAFPSSTTFYQTRIQIPGKAHTGTIDCLPMHASQTKIHISFAGLGDMRVEKRSQRSSNFASQQLFPRSAGQNQSLSWPGFVKQSTVPPQTDRTVIRGFYSFFCLILFGGCYPAPIFLTDHQLSYWRTAHLWGNYRWLQGPNTGSQFRQTWGSSSWTPGWLEETWIFRL